MKKIRLGKTGLMVTKTSFGALPIQRVSMEEAKKIIRKAYDNGINYFDTANGYTDSEKKLGEALEGVRHNVIISTKSGGRDKKTVAGHIENSLRSLKTDYIDLFQFHNPAVLPDINDPDGPFAVALEAKQKGYIRHIGITNHRLAVAHQAIDSGWFETLQFPFSYLAADVDFELLKDCEAADMGFIAMKGLAGGLLNNAEACFAFMQQYENVVPIWGIQHEWELDQWLELDKKGIVMNDEIRAFIEKERNELKGNFCRSCGYCLPCPAGIDIPSSARMTQALRRMPYQQFMTTEYYEKMHQIENCTHCNSCKSRCPYGLDTPVLLRQTLKDYDEFYAQHKDDAGLHH